MLRILMLLFCIKYVVSFRVSFCIGKNEEFSLCGWRCPASCVNLRMLATDSCPSTWECRVGCRCAAGYVREEYTKKCILLHDCPNHNTTTMETVLLACTFAAFALSATGAPTYSASEEEQILRQYPEDYPYLRETRSQYSPQFVVPCAAAAAAASANPVHGYAPFHLNVPSYNQYGYGGPHYRSVDAQMAEPEMLAFSDMGHLPSRQALMMDHIPMARSGYGGGPISSVSPVSTLSSGLALNGQVLTSAGGPAYGVFPNANVGGCNIPLLFSCSPSISSGHMVEGQGLYSSIQSSPIATANSYRLVEDQPHHSMSEHSEESLDQHIDPIHEASHGHQAHT